MTPINFHKKEKPLTSLVSMGGGAAGMQFGGGADVKTYIDDVFSTYVYTGNQVVKSLTSGLDLAGEGGMVWFKSRANGWSHRIWDTERGQSKFIYTHPGAAQLTDTAPGQNNNMLASFDSNGVTIGKDNTYGGTNYGDKFVNWQFRKAKGFFDVVTYNGAGGVQTVPHNLGSVPGCIMIKRTNTGNSWRVYHRSIDSRGQASPAPQDYALCLNDATNRENYTYWNDTAPTATEFTVADSDVNGSGGTYVAYLFGGGASTAATARGVRFDGSDDYLSLGASNDFNMGTGDFTIECWLNRDDTSNNSAWTLGSYQNGMELYCYNDDSLRVYGNNGGGAGWLIQSAANTIKPNEWNHVAVVRHSGTLTLYKNGIPLGSTSHTTAMPNNSETNDFFIGVEMSSGNTIPGTNPYFDGEISNFRVVKGTAVYTSSFRPPYEPLTNITNTKLLCCNNSSVTGSTVTPGTITAHSAPQGSTDSPFDDSEGFKFGEEGDQNIIKCGHYKGNGTTQSIEVGFEPQWVMVKNVDWNGGWWTISDSMRGAADRPGDNDQKGLFPNDNQQEVGGNYIGMYSTGFELLGGESSTNRNTDNYVYVAIRRSDGYVGKPVEDATKVFSMSSGKSGSQPPNYEGGNVVDWHLTREANTGNNWYTGARLMGPEYLMTNDTAGENGSSTWQYDYMNGYNTGSSGGSWKSYQWKRHAGFDIVCYKGNGNNTTGRNAHVHNLGIPPEMIWIKTRSGPNYGGVTHWTASHKDLNGGTNPWSYTLSVNNDWAESAESNFGNTSPTSEVFYVGDPGNGRSNGNNDVYMAMLFASVTGVSKVGSYSGSAGNVTVSDVGFSPRWLFVKNITTAGSAAVSQWNQVSTDRGFSAGNDARLRLNDSSGPNNYNYAYPTATGFVVTEADWKQNGATYIYYAHA